MDSEKVEFHNVKVPGYQTQHADGALAGVTPSGLIYLSFYLERMPTPQKVTVTLSQGEVEDLKEDGKSGILREINAGVVMNSEVAEEVARILTGLVARAREEEQDSSTEGTEKL
jgi:hypothetical protein